MLMTSLIRKPFSLSHLRLQTAGMHEQNSASVLMHTRLHVMPNLLADCTDESRANNCNLQTVCIARVSVPAGRHACGQPWV